MAGEGEVPGDLRGAVDFHGHLCPGLVIGYRAARAALERLGVERARDEELVCVAENNSCSVDAVQYLAGCTFGKGNLFFRDYGKQVFTFARRDAAGRAVRVSLRPVGPGPGGEAPADPARAREERIEQFLSLPEEEMFSVEEVALELPGEARILPSVPCEECGEPVMSTRLVEAGDRRLCIPCSEGRR